MKAEGVSLIRDPADRMPVLFVGHGSPMNAIEDNEFSKGWREAARALPKPKAILCVSAHWETSGTRVTAMDKPRTIHDFGGFPRELFAVQYAAPGSPWLAEQTRAVLTKARVEPDNEWGLDHGCWSVLRQMYPDADVPVVQVSLDATQPARRHYELAGELSPLREQGVLILCSGNIVHNLRLVVPRGDGFSDFNAPYGLEWAIEANELFKKLINEDRHDELVDYRSLGKAAQLAIPTAEHYLPMLWAIALRQPGEVVSFFNDAAVGGSLTMTSFRIDRPR